MKIVTSLVVAAVLSLTAGGAADAKGHHHGARQTSATVDTVGAYYTNVSGHRVHRPVHAATRPAGASAQCAYGSYSFSEHWRGTCSHHGGVTQWY